MARKIHLFVENPHDINTDIHHAVKDHMMLYPASAVSFPNVVTRSAAFWITGKFCEIIADHSNVAFGLFFTPNIEDLQPPLGEGKLAATHQKPCPVPAFLSASRYSVAFQLTLVNISPSP